MAIYAFLVSVGVYVYGRVASRIAKEGGKVPAEHWGMPELLMSFVLAGTFILLTVAGFLKQAKDEDEAQSKRFLDLAGKLEADGDLNPTDAEPAFERLMEKAAPPKRRGHS